MFQINDTIYSNESFNKAEDYHDNTLKKIQKRRSLMKIIFFDVLSRDFQAAFTLLSLVVFFMSIEAVHRLSIAAKTNMGREWFWSLLLQSSGIRKYIYVYFK